MKKKFIKNYEVFQGKKYLKENKNYFEGWYFKNTNGRDTISFIPGISISKDKRNAFIQVITNKTSYYFEYDIMDFSYNNDPFSITINNNYFSKDFIHIDINTKDLKIKGNIKSFNIQEIHKNILKPNIMGIFSYIPFMECNHALLNMKSDLHGYIKINDKKIKFKRGIGYSEKDWGTSFPKEYIWLQANHFKNKKASFMLSIATIPFKVLKFKGLICSLLIDNKEYCFATYNNSKIKKCEIKDNKLLIIIKKGNYYLTINTTINKGNKLNAPIKGQMLKSINESIEEQITITLTKKDSIIFSDISSNCGLEIVK